MIKAIFATFLLTALISAPAMAMDTKERATVLSVDDVDDRTQYDCKYWGQPANCTTTGCTETCRWVCQSGADRRKQAMTRRTIPGCMAQ